MSLHAHDASCGPASCGQTDSQPHGAPADAGRDAGAALLTGRRARLVAPLALGGITVVGCAAVAFANPGDDGVPLCWSRSVFGVDCPFCGGLRATNSLLRLDPAAAADHNVVLTVLMPVVVLMWAVGLVRSWRGEERPRPLPRWLVWGTGCLILAFGVARNFTGPVLTRWLHSDAFSG